MDVNLSAFREPRGVMRVLHFVFSICAFATITSYNGHVKFKCSNAPMESQKTFGYPFQLNTPNINITKNCTVSLIGDFSSDAKFFVATGVLAMLYALAISAVYLKLEDMYKSNNRQLPMIDFVITVIFGVLWLSSSAAWANGLTGLKDAVEPSFKGECTGCTISTSNFSVLNISVIFGFLNFFLWAADLWFLYKETAWFQGNQPQASDGV